MELRELKPITDLEGYSEIMKTLLDAVKSGMSLTEVKDTELYKNMLEELNPKYKEGFVKTIESYFES